MAKGHFGLIHTFKCMCIKVDKKIISWQALHAHTYSDGDGDVVVGIDDARDVPHVVGLAHVGHTGVHCQG